MERLVIVHDANFIPTRAKHRASQTIKLAVQQPRNQTKGSATAGSVVRTRLTRALHWALSNTFEHQRHTVQDHRLRRTLTFGTSEVPVHFSHTSSFCFHYSILQKNCTRSKKIEEQSICCLPAHFSSLRHTPKSRKKTQPEVSIYWKANLSKN